MKEIAFEHTIADSLVSFFENAAELGCPQDQEVDMWFRYLTPQERNKVMNKLVEIQNRTEELEERDIIMKEITLDIEDDIVEEIIHYARSKVVNDEKALINYGVNAILKEIVDTWESK